MNEIKKVIRDGKVGVLFSPGFGAGFLTWGAPIEAIFDPKLIELVENNEYQEAVNYVESTYTDVYTGGVFDLTVAWVPEGIKFIIEEYDGNERIRIMDETEWITA